MWTAPRTSCIRQANQDLALRAGREGIVLLKNEKGLLPLKKNLKSVAVIGPDAVNLMNQLGDYSPKAIPQHVVSNSGRHQSRRRTANQGDGGEGLQGVGG